MTAGIASLMVVGSSLSVLAAVQGSQDNPLVTLGYIKEVFTKSVLQEADQKIEATRMEYEKKLDAKVTSFREEIQQLPSSGTGQTSTAVFAPVELVAGKSLVGSLGCEVLLRSGSAIGDSSEAGAFLDTTTAVSLENGSALEKNHLYLMSVEGASVKAQGSTAKFLVRGAYIIVS